MPLVVEPVTLEGHHVRLEPLSMEHHAALCSIALDDEIWRWFPWQVQSPDEMRGFIESALKARAEGNTLAFTTILKAGNQVVGGSRFLNIDKPNRHVEIGATFIGKQWQRTVVNTEAKYLMLRHAFETLGCIRVEFKTDVLNISSRNALLRIGAKEEGIFRNHIITTTGRIRDSIFFSITDGEWPAVKADLETKLSRSYPPRA
jgi:RimJ/RimL family protein N-acetyltransferase